MSYAIFRVEPIQKLKDLGQIGAHNQRQKEAYKSNPDIDITRSKDNIEIVPLSEKYNEKQFCLKYTRHNSFSEPFKMIPLINKKGINKVNHFGLLSVPLFQPIRKEDNSIKEAVYEEVVR